MLPSNWMKNKRLHPLSMRVKMDLTSIEITTKYNHLNRSIILLLCTCGLWSWFFERSKPLKGGFFYVRRTNQKRVGIFPINFVWLSFNRRTSYKFNPLDRSIQRSIDRSTWYAFQFAIISNAISKWFDAVMVVL